jgi:hypothetical protein
MVQPKSDALNATEYPPGNKIEAELMPKQKNNI